MRFSVGVRSLLAALFLIGISGLPLAAQTGTLTGTVIEVETGAPLLDVQVEVRGLGEGTGILTNAQGRFQFDLAPGTYSLIFTHAAYRTHRMDGVSVTAGQNPLLTVTLSSYVHELNPLVVSVSGKAEKALDAPAHIETIGSEAIRERIAVSPMEHLKGLPGVDIAHTGLTQSNVVARGFNNVFSGALLIMTDNRYTHVPSLRFNANNMIASTDLDIDRIEVFLGPGAALYGPNSASGVMHIITKSPIDDPGGTVYLSAGIRSGNDVNSDAGSVFQTGFRYAHLINQRTGIKFSGEYMQGDDWEYIDALEELGGYPAGERDFATERYRGELRFDHRLSEDSEFVLSAGYNMLAKSIELTGLGAGQAKDWAYKYVQGRFTSGRLFAQAFLNQSDAGDTFLLQTGMPIRDKSRMMAGQIQHGLDLGERQSFIYGVDIQRTEPRTDGTITGINEDDDIIDEIGGYVHSETTLSDQFKLVAALRVDHNSRLEDLVFSPRAALVFTPMENQTLRATFNRAFSTPTTNNLFLDLLAAQDPFGLVPKFGVGYDIRTFGVPETGLTFNDRCGGTFCMYTPFIPGTQLSSGGPGALWNVFMQASAAADPSLAPLLPFLLNDNPDIATYLLRFNQEALGFVPDLEGPTAIERMKPTITNTFELGYKGMASDRLLLSADVYYSKVTDFVGPLRTETPSVFMDGQSIGAYVVGALTPAVQMGYITPAQLAAIATALATNLAQLPIGTIAPDQRSNEDLILTYRNFGDVDFWGADIAAQLIIDDRLSFRASASYVSEECFDFNEDGSCSSSEDISLNAPAKKGSFSARWSDVASGWTLEGQVRYSDAFNMNSGVYIGLVDQYTVLDANIGYRLPMAPQATLTLTASNIFDNLHQEFIGAPELGRLLMLRLQYEF